MRAFGITCGIGSMLIGARQAGFDIIGNIEWRKYYHKMDEQGRNTFYDNFFEDQGPLIWETKCEDLAPFEVELLREVDLAMGHPDCGNFSNLSSTATGKSLKERSKDAGDIPIFVDLIKKIKPRFFVQDNLPKSLIGYPIQRWAEELPEYDLFPEWVSNWGYGNIQKYRNRFFMIGALKEEGFVFYPNEKDHIGSLRELLFNLPDFNQDNHTLEGNTSKGRGLYDDSRGMTWKEYRDFMLSSPDGTTIQYKSADGTWKSHVGWRKAFIDSYVPVITGGCPIANPITGLPFSIRERCRIQGIPDDFKIYGTKFEEDGTWNHSKNSIVIKQTGKCMPVQFCRYISQQIAAHIKDEYSPMSNTRILNPNPYINEAKKWYCKNIGYSEKELACDACWIKNCSLNK